MRKVLFTLLALVILTSLLIAAPARPGFRIFTQPDGSRIGLELKGDEHFHFARTEDNYSVVKDTEGWWTYAQKIDGLLLPTFLIVGKDECPFTKGLTPDIDAVANLPVNEFRQINWKNFADIDIYSKTGRNDSSLCVALGAFDDSTYFGTTRPANNDDKWDVAAGFASAATPGGTAHDSLYWDSVFFSDGPASFKSYYSELSFGTWNCYGQVFGPVSSGDDYYRYGDGAELSYMQDIEGALGGRMHLYPGSSAADYNNDGEVTYEDFDGDGDGYVDHFCVVRCGGEQSATGDPNDMWATKYTTTISTSWSVTILNPVNAGELTQQDITKDNTLDTMFVRSRTMGIGVFAHESFHAFGAPDLYSYQYLSTTAGDWSLMDGGSWTGDGVQDGSRPAHPGGMLQYDIPGRPELAGPDGFFSAGWMQQINTNGRYPIVGLGLPASYGGPKLYLAQNATFAGATEYFLIENRCDYGVFEGNLPEFGLIISHYDPSEIGSRYNEGPDTENYFTYWVEQEGFDPVVHETYPNDTIYRNVGSAAYRAGESDEFTNLTSAAANQNGSTANFGPYIMSISAPGDTMWFTLANATVPAGAIFAFKTMTVLDTIVGYGNDNGVANPDEMFDLTVALTNVGGNANTVTAVLTNTDGKANVTDANGTWGTISTNAVVENTGDAFRIKLNSGYETGEYVLFNLAVSSSNGNADIGIAILLNDANIVQHFNLGDVSADLIDPSGIDVIYHPAYGWLMFASGTGLGGVYGTGASRLYMFDLATMGATVSDNMGVPSYIVGLDHDSNLDIWFSVGDNCYSYNIAGGLTGAVLNGQLTWHNSAWAGTPMKRVRGITFDNNDSLYAYWQVYDPSFVESLFGETKNLGGTGQEFAGWPLNDGESYGGHWNNGRGLEWDGTCFWSINIFIPTLYRRDPTTFEYFYKTPIPSVFGSYPSYDIAWSAEGPTGIDDVTPYKPGNRYYIWTVNMDNADVYKLEVTTAVLPSAVDLDMVLSSSGGAQTDLVWNANLSAEMVSHYIVYRSTDPNFYASSSDSIGTTAGLTYTDNPPISKATVFYYSVRAVNYHGYSENTSYDVFESDFSTALHTVNMNAIQIDNNVVLSWRPDNTEGIKWNILRKSKTDADYKAIGSININKEELVNEFKYVDESISNNGIYNYKLELVTSTGNKIEFNEISFKYFNELVFGIKALNQNPIKGDIVLNYGIDKDGDISLNIYNITGALISSPVKGNVNTGMYSIRINTSDIPAGTYFAILKQGDRESKQRIMLFK